LYFSVFSAGAVVAAVQVDYCSSPWVALAMAAEAAVAAVDLADSAEAALAVVVQAEIGKSAQYL
jgi:hypothetical protein